MDCRSGLVSLILVSHAVTLALLLEGGQSSITNLEADITNLKSNFSLLRNEVDQYLAAATTKSAFMAILSGTITNCVSAAPLIFDTVPLNEGGGYDKRHGTFRAPRDGVYHFGITLSASPRTHYHVKLVKNSVDIELGYLYQSTTDSWTIKTTSLVVKLKAGDDVWWKCAYDYNSTIAGRNTFHSHFSGFFIMGP